MTATRVSRRRISSVIVCLNKSRGEICSDVYSNPKLRYVIGLIHEARDIHQINSVPVNSVCCIDKKKIPISSAGIQFIIYARNSNTHVCVQKKSINRYVMLIF